MDSARLVERSALGFSWRLRDAAHQDILTLGQRFDLPEFVRRLLVSRGCAIDAIPDFLNPTLRSSLPDPFHLLDMRKAAERLADALEQREPVAIFGDYDVDGATSSALLHRYWSLLGQPCRVYIPDRQKEGYGPNAPALTRLHTEGARVVITVDCGTLSYEPLAHATALGLDVIVVDHHAAEARLPTVFALINPNRLDQESPCTHLAAVGVSFLLLIALHTTLRARGFFDNGHAEPDLLSFLDLVALGTVCDVMPLQGLNRAFVAQGLRILGHRSNVGLRIMADQLKLETSISAYHLGFVIGPRINAGGRVGESTLGVRLLTTTDPSEAHALCQSLEEFNAQRKDIEADALREARAMADHKHQRACLVLSSPDWHPGIIGIVAGRLRELYHRPVCIVALNGETGKGSGRSIPGIDLGNLIRHAAEHGCILQGGGHAMAAGFSLHKSQLAEFEDFMDKLCRNSVHLSSRPSVEVDACLSVGGITVDTAHTIETLGPFGSGNPTPKFVLRGVLPLSSQRFGRKDMPPEHIRCTLVSALGGTEKVSAVAFRSCQTALEPLLTGEHPLDVLGTLRLQRYREKESVQFWIDDAARSEAL